MTRERKPFSKTGLLRYPSDFVVKIAYSSGEIHHNHTICNRYEIPRRESVLVRKGSGDCLRRDPRQFTSSSTRLKKITKIEIDVDGGLFMRF